MTLASGLALASLLLGCAVSTEAPPAMDLTGTWKLDARYSDDVSELMRAAGRSGGLLSGVGGGISIGGISVGGNWPNQGGGPGPGTQVRDLLDNVDVDTLRIDQSTGKTVIRYDGGRTETYEWGRVEKGNQTVEAGWSGDDFILELKQSDAPDLKQTITLGNGGKNLTVVSTVSRTSISQLYELQADGQ